VAELVVYLKERELSRHTIRSAAVRVGRDPASDLVLDNVGISRHHATVFFDGAQFRIKDEGSQNGVFINGVRVSSEVLKPSDQVQLGKFALRLEQAPNEPERVMPQRNVPVDRARLSDPQKTMALGASDVARLIEQQVAATGQGAQAQREEARSGAAQSGGPLRTLLIGLALVALVGIAGYWVLIR
jgi:pSer/pThr/pTyr-binding forkhead associated (FHA) protein